MHVVRHVPTAPRVSYVSIYLRSVARQPFVAGAVLKACVECRESSGRIGGGVGHGSGQQVEGGGARQDHAGPSGCVVQDRRLRGELAHGVPEQEERKAGMLPRDASVQSISNGEAARP
jgi:hypothetical protein